MCYSVSHLTFQEALDSKSFGSSTLPGFVTYAVVCTFWFRLEGKQLNIYWLSQNFRTITTHDKGQTNMIWL